MHMRSFQDFKSFHSPTQDLVEQYRSANLFRTTTLCRGNLFQHIQNLYKTRVLDKKSPMYIHLYTIHSICNPLTVSVADLAGQGWFPFGEFPLELEQCSASEECLPFSYCKTLRPDSERHYCRWGGGGESYLCCPQLKTSREQQCGILGSGQQYSIPRHKILGAAIGGIPLRTATASPWMVAIGERTRNGSIDWYCGGSLIQDNRVLTAAHCVVRRKAHVVRVGELDFSRENEDASPFDVGVSDIKVHPGYKPPSYYNDIAVLKLREGVKFGRYVKPVCLPDADDDESYEGEIATLTGWGHLSFGGEKSPVLQEVSVTVMHNDECSRLYSRPQVPRLNYPKGIVDSQLCAGDPNGGKDACQGDSGGPLVVSNGNKRVLIGVVSSGVGCGSKAFPGVYTRVISFADWIQDQL